SSAAQTINCSKSGMGKNCNGAEFSTRPTTQQTPAASSMVVANCSDGNHHSRRRKSMRFTTPCSPSFKRRQLKAFRLTKLQIAWRSNDWESLPTSDGKACKCMSVRSRTFGLNSLGLLVVTLVRRFWESPTYFGRLPNVTDYDDYRKVGHLRLPFLIRRLR